MVMDLQDCTSLPVKGVESMQELIRPPHVVCLRLVDHDVFLSVDHGYTDYDRTFVITGDIRVN